MRFASDPADDQREERDRKREVRMFYISFLYLTSLALLLFWVATGEPWWAVLAVDPQAGAAQWGPLAVRALTVPLPSLIAAFMISDARTYWVPLVYTAYLLVFVVLLWMGTGVKFWRI